MPKTISEDVLAVLSGCTIDDTMVKIGAEHAIGTPGQLDRKLYTRVNAVLEALGGKWNRKAGGHVFGSNPIDAFDAALITGEYVNPQQAFGFFETPPDVAAYICDQVGIGKGQKILEPSAGRGAIARIARDRGARVICVEIQKDLATGLRNGGFEVRSEDFLKIPAPTRSSHPECFFDTILMNPPFARQQDVDHVRHAFEFLALGGVLCSVMSAGVEFREDRKAHEFRTWVDGLGGDIERLPEGSFKASGTGVNTVMVTLRVR